MNLSVIDGGRVPVAVINGELLQTGELIGSFRIKSIQALGRVGGAETPYLLADVLREEEDPVVRREAVSTLGTLDRDSARWALKLATRDRDPAVRQVAYEALLGKAAAILEEK